MYYDIEITPEQKDILNRVHYLLAVGKHEQERLVVEDILAQIVMADQKRRAVGKPKTAPTAQIYNLRQSGYTQEQIAQQTGVSLSTVRRELRKKSFSISRNWRRRTITRAKVLR